jgi:hypothetical protein
MKHLVLIAACSIWGHLAWGQTLAPTLIGSAGAHASLFSFGTLDWSVGEVVVATFENGDVLTQGFHQVFVTVTSLTEEDVTIDDLKILVYPNPTMQWLNVEADKPTKVRLINLLGVEVKAFSPSLAQQQLDLSILPAGMYVLEAIIEGETAPRTYKVEILR